MAMGWKEQIADKLLCMSCLCVGRKLTELCDGNLKGFYMNALSEMSIYNMEAIEPLVCWECEAVMRKAVSFQQQILQSYWTLHTYNYENIMKISRPPRLLIQAREPVNIEPEDKQVGELKQEANGNWNGHRTEVNLENADLDEYLSDADSHYDSETDVDVKPLIKLKTQKRREDGGKKMKKIQKNKKANEVLIKDGFATATSSDVFLKDEVKFESEECSRDEFDTDKRKQKKSLSVKIKKKKKKDLQNGKSDKKKKECKIITIDLPVEEMLQEREKERCKHSFISSPYRCDDCVVGFKSVQSYNTHMKSKHDEKIGQYQCPVCKTVAATMEVFTSHYKRHMRRYECGVCGKRAMSQRVMQQHYFSKHDISLKEYKCNLCGKVSNSLDSHRYHRDSHKARVQCPECDKTFSHRAGLMNHRLAVHELNNEFPCSLCDKVFRWKTSLKRHTEKHDLKGKAASSAAFCTLCGISFSSRCSYQRHLKNSLKHVSQDQLRFICDHCSRRFADKTKLRDHIEEKHLYKTYHCHICAKKSKNRVGLEQHIRNVHKGRPNNKMCHHCGKGFPTKVQLESHIRTHTGERPFICELCPTTFSQHSNLYKHNRQVHLNIKSKRYPACKKPKPAEKPYDQAWAPALNNHT